MESRLNKLYVLEGIILPTFFSHRSTPRRDAVYGGQDDLTAAIGWEEDGVTTVIFRKPASGAQVCFI